MKKATLVLLMMAWAYIVHSQQIIYTISAFINGETTHLDSILFENLENQTRFVAGDLPLLPAYDIDLSLQLLVTGMNQINLPTGKSFRLTRHIPGEIGLQFTGSVAEQARLTVYSMSGQMVFARRLPVVNPQEVITVNIPGSGMYVLSLETSHGRVHFKALGSPSGAHNSFSLSVMAQPVVAADAVPVETRMRTALSDDGFSYQVGDSLRVTAFLDGHYTQPHGGRITDSRSISFTMLQGTAFSDPRDGQVYRWVKIGDQIWMAENLKYLPAVAGPGAGSETDPYYYVYGYDGNDVSAAKETENYRNYGVLYNWPAAMAGASSSGANPSGVQGVCPPGWHVPSDAEWTQLLDYVVAQGYPNEDVADGAGNALKSCRQVDSPLGGICNTSYPPRWVNDTHYGTDVFGFSALPGGDRRDNGNFGPLDSRGYWWSATDFSSSIAWHRIMGSYFGYMSRNNSYKDKGFSIRCLKDADAETDSYTLTLEVSPPEAGSVQGAGEFRAGEQAGISAAANTDWEFVSWTDSTGAVVATTADHDFVMPAGNVTLTANFKKKTAYETGTFTDPRDEQVYAWIKIGEQVWMAENLKYLPEVVGPGTGSETTVYYYVQGYNGTDVGAARATANYHNYGVLYNWTAAMAGASSSSANPSGVQGVCPPGWHVPSHDEWTELERHVCETLGNADCDAEFPYDNTSWNWRGTNEGNALKSCRQVNSSHGESCNTSDHPRWDAHDIHYGIDEFGFSALPGGNRRSTGSFSSTGGNGHWWSATETHSDRAWERIMRSNYGGVYRNSSNKAIGYSIRCIKNKGTGPDAYTLTLKVSPPEAGSVQGAGEYQAGEQVSISATANTDWEFVSWTDSTGAVVATTADHDFVMPVSNVTLTANFKKKTTYETGTFTDPRDGQVYRWVEIGDQVWMAENLKYLPSVVGQGTGSETAPYYYVYDYDGIDASAAKATANYRNYGVLYNWTAAMAGASSSSANPSGVQGVCPPGWHLPSHDEWTELERFVCAALGNADCDTKFPYNDTLWGWRGTNEGNALKSCRQENSPLSGICNTSEHPRWNASGTNFGTDMFWFSALPGGQRWNSGGFVDIGGYGLWWSATKDSAALAWYRSMFNHQGNLNRNYHYVSSGFSIRCLRDTD